MYCKGPSFKDVRPEGRGAVKQKWTTSDGTSISEDFEQIFCVLNSKDTPPPRTSMVVRIVKYVAFSRDAVRTLDRGRGCLKSKFLLGRL